MNRCPDEVVLERLLVDDTSSAEWSTHVVTCERCRSWLSDARADDAMLTTVREAWTRGRSAMPVSERLLAPPSPRRIEPATDEIPDIPGFELLRRIGEGGMGVVYEARQLQPERIVAIKVVRGGASASQFRNQLIEHEAAALARLRHPNIAAVYSAGRTDDGLFYVAMERIHGPRITQFADDAGLTVKQRLAWFEKICRAIQHAHQQGVVHGDIKPGNILVDIGNTKDELSHANGRGGYAAKSADGELGNLKVLDFGLSRLVDSSDGPRSTAGGKHIRGTPAYMSPEQAGAGAGEIDHRSDIYALGALAYELLTGRQPHDLNGLPIDAALDRVRDGEIAPPSRINSRLRGDVDLIVMKALARDPDARYSGAVELADDVRRFLAHEPVRARPASRLYSVRCFLHRHALGSAFAACVVLGLTAFAAIELVHAQRLTQERDRALRINKFMQDMIADLDPSHTGGPEISLRSVLDDASSRVEAQFADDPETAATTQLAIGQSYLALGYYDKAEQQFRSALTRRQSVHGTEHGDVAEAMHELGLVLKLAKRHAEAEPLYVQALDMRRRLLPPDDPGIPESLNDLGALCVAQDRFAEAEAYFREALELRKAHYGDQDKEYAVGLYNVAMMNFFQGKAAEAEPLVRQALEIRQRLFGDRDPIILKQLTSLSYMAMHTGGDPAVTEKLVRELLERQRKLLGPDHPEVKSSMTNLAIMLRKRGDETGAAEIERALASRRTVESNPD